MTMQSDEINPQNEENNTLNVETDENLTNTTAETVEQVMDETAKTAETVATLTQSLAELQDQYLRLAAEYDNYQKRTQKERLELIKTASERTIKAVLPIIDDFNRMSMVLAHDTATPEVTKEGFSLIQQKFLRVLGEQGVKEMQTVGEVFNPDLHEAIGELPAPEENLKGCVVAEVDKGYYLHEKVLRYAKVMVGK